MVYRGTPGARYFFPLLLLTVFLLRPVLQAFAAPPDGLGPWADEVISVSQGTTKDGQPVSPARSDPNASLGVAENDTVDSHFFSLGFQGSLTLKFANGVQTGLIVVEATNPDYPIEKALVQVSADGSAWVDAGIASQDEKFRLPRGISCVNYVRLTDISNPEDFTDPTADGFDVDGVQAKDSTPCTSQTPTPTPDTTITPTLTISPTTTPTPTTVPSGNSTPPIGGPACSDTNPATPTLLSVTKTSSTVALLTWTAVSPATHYAIYYGTSPGNYQYGVANTGNTTSFLVGGLDPNLTYYFQVRAVNGCTPGDPSGELSVARSVLGTSNQGQVLGASTLGNTGNSDLLLRLLSTTFVSLGVFMLSYSQRFHGAKVRS